MATVHTMPQVPADDDGMSIPSLSILAESAAGISIDNGQGAAAVLTRNTIHVTGTMS